MITLSVSPSTRARLAVATQNQLMDVLLAKLKGAAPQPKTLPNLALEPTRYGRRRKAGLWCFVTFSQPGLTPPASTVGSALR